MSIYGRLDRPWLEGEPRMDENTLTNTVYIRTTPVELWRALTDGDLSVQYVGARVESSWRPGEEIVYLSPDRTTRLVQGTLLEVVPNRRFVFDGRLLADEALATDRPHRELFEIEDLGDICRCTAVFDQYAPHSPTRVIQGQ